MMRVVGYFEKVNYVKHCMRATDYKMKSHSYCMSPIQTNHQLVDRARMVIEDKTSLIHISD